MSPTWLMFLENAGVGVVVAAVTAWITVRLSLKNFRAERWWERKSAAYADAIGALHRLKRGLQEDLSHFYTGSQPVLEGRRDYLQERFEDEMRDVFIAVDMSPFLLCQEASCVLDEFIQALERTGQSKTGDSGLPPSIRQAEAALEATSKCIQDLSKIGKSDIKVG